jgi:hypothetical protein
MDTLSSSSPACAAYAGPVRTHPSYTALNTIKKYEEEEEKKM